VGGADYFRIDCGQQNGKLNGMFSLFCAFGLGEVEN
jgi:hypothetical protein